MHQNASTDFEDVNFKPVSGHIDKSLRLLDVNSSNIYKIRELI